MTACQQGDKPPAGVLSQKQMVSLHVDFHMEEAKVRELRIPVDSGVALYAYLKNRVLREHGVDTSTYNDSYLWYLEHPGQMKDLYDIVIDSLKYRNDVVLPAKRNDEENDGLDAEDDDPQHSGPKPKGNQNGKNKGGGKKPQPKDPEDEGEEEGVVSEGEEG